MPEWRKAGQCYRGESWPLVGGGAQGLPCGGVPEICPETWPNLEEDGMWEKEWPPWLVGEVQGMPGAGPSLTGVPLEQRETHKQDGIPSRQWCCPTAHMLPGPTIPLLPRPLSEPNGHLTPPAGHTWEPTQTGCLSVQGSGQEAPRVGVQGDRGGGRQEEWPLTFSEGELAFGIDDACACVYQEELLFTCDMHGETHTDTSNG